MSRFYQLRPSSPPRPRAQSFVASTGTAAVPAAPSEPAPPAAPAKRVYPDTRNQRLIASELKELGIATAAAWKVYLKASAGEGASIPDQARDAGMSMKQVQDHWRHGQVKVATAGRCARLRDLSRADFRTVKAHFLTIAGIEEQAFHLMLRTGRAASRAGAAGDVVETVEQADRAIAGIFEKIVRHFAAQGDPATARDRAASYLAGTVAQKEKTYACGWRSWAPKQKWQLYFTLKNRLAEMEGTGSPQNRNKSQRRKAKEPAVPPPPSSRDLF